MDQFPIYLCHLSCLVPSKSLVHEGCYALKAWRQYPNARNAWLDNWEYYNSFGQAYFDAIVDNLSRVRDLPFFRWHVAGDIPSPDYLNGMAYVAKALPNTRFLAFTKNGTLDVSSLPDNLVIRYSYWPNYKPLVNSTFLNFAGLTIDERLSGYVCKGNCRHCCKCWSRVCKTVVFNKH